MHYSICRSFLYPADMKDIAPGKGFFFFGILCAAFSHQSSKILSCAIQYPNNTSACLFHSYMTMPFRERHQREMKQGWCFRNRV